MQMLHNLTACSYTFHQPLTSHLYNTGRAFRIFCVIWSGFKILILSSLDKRQVMELSAVRVQFISRVCHSLGVHSMHRHRVNNSVSLKINLGSSGHDLLKQRLAGEPISLTRRQLQNVNRNS